MQHTVTYNHQSQFIELIRDCETYLSISDLSLNFLKGITPTYVESSCVEVINQACVTWEGIDFSKVKYQNSESSFAKGILNSYDLLLTMTGRGTLGRCTIFCPENDDITYIADSHISILRVNNTLVLPIIIAKYISLSDTQDEIYRNYVTGSTNQLDIVFSKIKDFKIPVPPMALQKKFAEIVRQADKSKFDGFKSQFIEMFGKYASTTRLEDLSETIIAGGDKPKDCTTDRTESNVYPVIANGIENDGIIGYSSSYRINSPSLTISARGTIGVTAIRSGMYTPIIRLIVIKPLRNINLTYLKYQLDYNGFQPTGAVQGQLTVPNVKNKMIPVPPLSEQEEFAAIVRQADKSKYCVQNKLNYICHILTNQIQLRRCS